MSKFKIFLRTKRIINTDPQRRCYNGRNFSERIEYGEWEFFQEWEGREFTERVAAGLRRDTQEVKVEPA